MGGRGIVGRWPIIGDMGRHDQCIQTFRQRDLVPAGRIARGAQGRTQDGKARMHPLIDRTLRQSKQLSVIHLRRILLQVAQHEQQAIFWCGQRTIRIGCIAAILPPLAFQRPCRHMRLKRYLKGWDQRLKLVYRETGYGQHVRRLRCNLSIGQSPHLAPPFHVSRWGV